MIGFQEKAGGKKFPNCQCDSWENFTEGIQKTLFLRNIRKEQNMFFVHHAGAHFKG